MDLRSKIRIIDDFPKPGISFKDITPLLLDGDAWRFAVQMMAGALREYHPNLVVAPEARGFLVGSALAYELGVGFVPVRKPGKLPFATLAGEYELEYGTDRLEIHLDAILPGQKVVIVDDLLATGGTVGAVAKLVESLGGEVAAMAFLIELSFLEGRKRLGDYPIHSLLVD